MPWVNTHLQRQGDPDSCIKSPWSDRSQWPAHSHWSKLLPSRAEMVILDMKMKQGLHSPTAGACQARAEPCHSSRTVFLQQCKEDQMSICCLFILCSPRKKHQEISNWPLLKVQTTPNWETSCLELFFSQVIKDFGQPLPMPCYPQSDFFSLYPVWNSHFSLCLFPLNLQPWTLVQSLAHLLTAAGDAVKTPEVFPSPGWSSEVLEATLRASVSGTDHCDTLTPGFYVSIHQDLLVLA